MQQTLSCYYLLHLSSSLLRNISLYQLLWHANKLFVWIYIPKFRSHNIWLALNISRFIDKTLCLNCISTVPTSKLDLGVITHILRTMLLTNWLGLAGALNEERLIDKQRYKEKINRK
jgi:hypothetical protein